MLHPFLPFDSLVGLSSGQESSDEGNGREDKEEEDEEGEEGKGEEEGGGEGEGEEEEQEGDGEGGGGEHGHGDVKLEVNPELSWEMVQAIAYRLAKKLSVMDLALLARAELRRTGLAEGMVVSTSG